jgi:Uma2 family endonuclease
VRADLDAMPDDGRRYEIIDGVLYAHGRPFVRADLDAMPDDGRRYEIIDGVLVVSAAPGRLHQRATRRLLALLDSACPAEFEVLSAPFTVALADDTQTQPDLLVGRQEDFTDKDLPAPPVLAVEILSPSTRIFDINVKRERVQRAGTPSFWVVDPVARPAEARLLAWDLGPDGEYRLVAKVTGEEKFRATLPYPVTVVPAALVR